MIKEITIKEALALDSAIFVDVRSEGEFIEATVPGAINIPVFNDEERARVGIVYKQEGSEKARKLGLEIVAPKLPMMVEKFFQLGQLNPIVILCWRGGMRSKSIATILRLMGFPVYRLIGGYKAYRRFVNHYLGRPQLTQKMVVLHGLTGVGKTEVIEELQQMGIAAVNLEALANNRGSVFGAIGLGAQPSQKNFEGSLVQQLMAYGDYPYLIVECESKRIGRILLPDILVKGMKEGNHLLLYAPLIKRVERLLDIYALSGPNGIEMCKGAINGLNQRLGWERVNYLSEQLDQGHLTVVAEELLVNYYDPLYNYPGQPSDEYELSVDTSHIKVAARQIANFVQGIQG
ncbi:MAG: tRNA 2-selenouridine(34) synthase MnmH [Clostridia bacterium]|nr:tRNA 2-selenouridine(34) synthase MnmH [Clostridia bacterium]